MGLFQKLPYDVLNDFAQISVAASFALLLAVPPTSPYKSLQDLIEAARKAPGKFNLGAINPAARRTFRRICSSRSAARNSRSSRTAPRRIW
jgi:tripartite-type tricarboxylate transporter receptor subunit TctC